ncbi:MAG: helix-turn-helix domain-containing protein [Rhodospirillaceae bacterium]|jgi:IclR family transcriptional regulator, mhp operon transcriptional activator|nr:helix-turn-helix domain-containing protein [Rhodospirillaceae bacterium]MBT5239369.1 helix-turn-helix domain-containing protein [Rhodospirillaceae bacterium]MBT5564212.1 helix-turn-helix domain-containing protein [Rhodospirillaceae bacterium]MBT6088480.1 helix-turn-helix domain-containing protein [Rhodospirillaceae bacterium]
MARIQPLESIERLARIMRSVNAVDGITMSDLALAVDLPRSAVNRYIVTLVNLGYVFRDERTRAYRPTSKTHELSKGVMRDQKIQHTVLPILNETCREIGWSLNFTTLKNAQVTLIANTDSVSPLATKLRKTMLMRPVLGRAAGHVLLAYLSEAVRQDVLSMAEQQTPDLYAQANLAQDQIGGLLDGIRDKGYAASKTAKRRLNTVAVPVHIKNAVPFCLSVGVDETLLSLAEIEARLLTPLQTCSKRLTECLSGLDTDSWQEATTP